MSNLTYMFYCKIDKAFAKDVCKRIGSKNRKINVDWDVSINNCTNIQTYMYTINHFFQFHFFVC